MHVAATLRNGLEVTVRAIRPDDRDRLARAFRGLERETVYTRFFRYVDAPSEAQLERATEFDPEHELALVVTIGSGADEAIIAGGRYIVTSSEGGQRAAEVAFLVEEDYQGLGIAGLLLRRLTEIGRRRGLTRFEAEVLRENGSMLRVFSRSGMPMEQQREGGVVHVRLSLAEPRRSAEQQA